MSPIKLLESFEITGRLIDWTLRKLALAILLAPLWMLGYLVYLLLFD